MPRCGRGKKPVGRTTWKDSLPDGFRNHPSQTAREEESRSIETVRTPSRNRESHKTEKSRVGDNFKKPTRPLDEKYVLSDTEDAGKPALVKETPDSETHLEKSNKKSQNLKDEVTDRGGDHPRGPSRLRSTHSQRNTNTANKCKPNKQTIRRNLHFKETQLRIKLQGAMTELVRISQEDRSSTSKLYNPIVDGIAEEIKKTAAREGEGDIFQFQRLNSGSYFERLKVDTTDEYDFMFCIRIHGEDEVVVELDEVEPSLGMVAVKPKNNSTSLASYLTPDGYLSPKKLLNRFRGLVERAVNSLRKAEAGIFKGLDVELEEEKDGCPAVTLVVSKEQEGTHISIDLVLALELPKPWPRCTEGWGYGVTGWLTERQIRAMERTVLHTVAKSAPYDKDPGGHKLWRLSFSQVEMDLFKSDMLNPTDSGNHATTCRKDCLRCLKYIKLQVIPINVVGTDSGFASYHLKTVLLHAIAKRPEVNFWEKENLVTCLVYLIDELVLCIDNRHLPHFFIPGYNLFNPAVFKGLEHLDIVREQYLHVREDLIERRLPQIFNVSRSSIQHNKSTQGIKHISNRKLTPKPQDGDSYNTACIVTCLCIVIMFLIGKTMYLSKLNRFW
ncbi:cyclic GMP-AMP synthase-like [Branchiostoma floridae x Branchiostoma japonicum]